MRYCNNCGVPLYPAAIAAGTCLACGAPISGEVIDTPEQAAAIAARFQREALPPEFQPSHNVPLEPGQPPLFDSTVTQPNAAVPPIPPPRKRRNAALWLLPLIFAALLILIFFLLQHRSSPSQTVSILLTTTPGTAATLTLSTSPTGVSATSTISVSGTSTPTVPTPVSNATPKPTGTIPPTPNASAPPTMYVSNVTFSQVVCLNTTVSFTISNSGGGSFSWTTTATQPSYTIQPKNGTETSGASTQVTVSQINIGGKITVHSTATNNPTQTITISCA